MDAESDRSIFYGRLLLVPLLFAPAIVLFALSWYDSELFLRPEVIREIMNQDALDERTGAVALALLEVTQVAMLVGPLGAAAWCAFASGVPALDDPGSRSKWKSWLGGLGLTAGLAAWLGWYWLGASEIGSEDPAFVVLITSLVLVELCVVAWFWLATAVFVRPAMRASVPGALHFFKY